MQLLINKSCGLYNGRLLLWSKRVVSVELVIEYFITALPAQQKKADWKVFK